MGSSAMTNHMLASIDSPSIDSIIFLGTGTSSCVPTIPCLTSSTRKCRVCLSTLLPDGYKNIRKNTSVVVRFRNREGELKTILIDCGKTFYDSALRVFPRHGIRKIDALILTHGHADAINGLDDLRSWTLGGYVQNHIDIYLSQETMNTVERAFTYLVDQSYATGGGDVASFRYHIIDGASPFMVEGAEFIPLPVHHGYIIASGEPFWSLGFRFLGISYISDVSYIPPSTFDLMRDSKLIVLDALAMMPHASHFSLPQAVEVVRKLKPERAYFVGFTHVMDHDETSKFLEKYDKEVRMRPAFDRLRVSYYEGQWGEDEGEQKMNGIF
ncbi:uncharacterized protein VTP21DRAFT_7496 [Calcarisporiella thermophila]|uniref:uncharacterized protein n=1 Tax=Calcarisporiella thermophila TaxID=911321 RepID=UPI003743475E